ncbi:hypothetical protein G7007_08090 [Pseudomonas entomophila]|uniref:hypothetical protein n=1 Tax=Pseudomonas entomophila TaxID=312306 RepID=UPI0015E29C43|nr:hypothetical protein [Pseudomonas entomophila]MBA1192818.1 hypothetical protein [Pseudomonas entomophila]
MIGENVSEQHEKARADLEASVAQFLAGGGKIQDCGAAASVPRRPSFRWYPDQQPQDKQPVQVQCSPQLLGRAIQAAKTMTVDEASAHLGASRAQLLTLSRKHSFCFRVDAKQRIERELRRKKRAQAQDALVDRIRAYAHSGLSRDAVAKLIGISQQRLTRLVDEHDIDFPKWRQPK